MSKRKTISEIKESVKILDNDYEVRSAIYKSNKDKIIFYHKNCQKEFEMSYHNFQAGNRCPHCRYSNMKKPNKLSFNDITKRIEKIDSNYRILTYNGTQNKALFLHKICNNTFLMTPNHFFSMGNRCNCQKGINKQRNIDEYKKIIKEINSDITIEKLPIDYHGSMDNRIEFLHIGKNHRFKTSINSFIYTKTCPICTKEERCEKRRKWFNKAEEKGVTILTAINDFCIMRERDKVSVSCNNCGHNFKITLKNLLNDNITVRCPGCKLYSGEREILNHLNSLNIPFIYHYKTDKCKNKNKLEFDFFIQSRNLIIEYDGEFHFLPIFGEDQYNIQKRRDQIKNDFCKDEKINILRIPYTLKKQIPKIIDISLGKNTDFDENFTNNILNNLLN